MMPIPEEFISWAKKSPLLKGEVASFLKALESPPAAGLRVNSSKISADDFRKISPWRLSSVPWCPSGFTLAEKDARPGRHALHAAGAYYLQDSSAMAAAVALDVRPGDLVLDLCAAPGGKATHIADMLGDAGFLVANEPHSVRVRALMENLERFGAHAAVLQEEPQRLVRRLGPIFDRVLVDAPCSGEGLFGKEPDSRGEWTPDSPAACAVRQAAILDAAAQLTREGGVIVYSTCTFNERENEETVAAFLTRHANFRADETLSLPGTRSAGAGMQRLWPHRAAGAGHFVARLVHSGENTGQRPSAPHKIMPSAAVDELLRSIVKDYVPPAIERHGSWLYQAPPISLAGLRVLRPGRQLADVTFAKPTPAHHLAMSLAPTAAHLFAELTSAEVRQFLMGEALPYTGHKGWTLATYLGFPLGFAKSSDDMLKNHRPKGLRLNADV